MTRKIALDRTMAFDKGSVRSFDTDGRLRISIANISKAQVSPYKGEEIPGWEELGLERDRIYQMLRDPDELKAAVPTFNGIQLLRKHVPVDADDHQMWDIVGTTGSDAAFDGTYLTNSLFVWTKEAIELIESGKQRELSCGYHYIPVMVGGTFRGHHFDGRMTRIEGNHVALVEEGRAGHDVVVGDAALVMGDSDMKSNRLQLGVLMRTAAAIKPLLAMDAKVNLLPIVQGLATKNFAERKAGIVAGVQKAIAGKTIAKDASIEHLAKALDAFNTEGEEAKGWDAELDEPQTKSMEEAAEVTSPLSAPVKAEDFAAPEPKKFGDSLRAWAKDRGLDLSDEDYSALDAMHAECGGKDEDMDAEDEKEDDEEKDDKKDGAEDESEEDDDKKDKGEKKPAAFGGKDKGAKDRQAKDKGGKAMDKGITQDELNKAIASATASERKRSAAANEAREFVRPYVGALPLALDSAESILRAAAKAMNIEDASNVHESALKQLIKMAGTKSTAIAADGGFFAGAAELAMDEASTSSFDKFFPGASRIGAA